jgi:hypothetical protein
MLAWHSRSATRDVVLPEQGRDDAEVGLVARAERECALLAHEGGQAGLEAFVQLEGPVEEARAGAAGAVAAHGLDRGLPHPGMCREAQVVVRPEHEEAPALDHDVGAVGLRDRNEVRIEPERREGAGIGRVAEPPRRLRVLEEADTPREQVHGVTPPPSR